MNILVRPLVTEKVSASNEEGIYGFVVLPSANKIEIKKEIKKLYGANVLKVNTMRYSGVSKVRYTRKRVMHGRTSSYKKAIVYLKKGESIDFYGNV